MAVTFTHLTTDSDTASNGSTYVTASISPSASALVLLAVGITGTNPTPTPTVTGCGLTWVQETQTVVGARTVHLFRAMGTPTAGAVTISLSATATGCAWTAVQFAGVDTTGTNGSGAIAQSVNSKPTSASSISVAFPASIGAGNATFGAFGTAVQETPAAGSGWSLLGATSYASPTTGWLAEAAASGQQNITGSWTTAANAFVVGAEIRAASTGDTTAPTVPSGVTAVANSATQVTVSWTASTDAVGVASYRVRRGGVNLSGATAVTGTSFVDATVTASTAYSYTVSAVDAAGNRSAESSAATVSTPAVSSVVVAPAGVDSRLYELQRGPHFSYGYVEAWRSGSAVQVEIDGVMTTRLPLTDGSVEVDGSTPGSRRVLSASFAPLPGLFDALSPTGTELKAFLVVHGPNGVEQKTAQGVFGIDSQRMGYAANGDIRITAPDRWKRVMDGRFLVPRASMVGSTVRAQIAALLNEAMPSGVTTVDVGTSAATVPAQVWDRDRDKAIEELAKAASLDVFMDRSGAPTIRDAPSIDTENVAWTVDAGDLGVMVSAERERNRQRTYNIVVVNGTPNDGVAPFPTVFVWDNDPNSPTYAGPGSGQGTIPPDPTQAGPLGQRPTFYSSPLLADVSQAIVAGQTILERVTGLESQLTLTAVPKPDLDDGSTILVKLPPEYPRGPIPLELHVVDKITISLRPSGGNPMSLSTRSTLVGYEGAE